MDAAAAGAELRTLAAGPGGAAPAPPPGAGSLKPGSTEGNAALAAAAVALKAGTCVYVCHTK